MHNPATRHVSLSRDVRWTDWKPLTQNDAIQHFDMTMPILPEDLNPVSDDDMDSDHDPNPPDPTLDPDACQ
jgi:hypothetical protein